MSPIAKIPVTPHAPSARVDLRVGDRVQLANGSSRRWWWTVAATSPNFAVVTHQAPFRPKGTLCYSVLDWRRGRRGPCNLLGQSFGDGSYSPEQCAQMLELFEAHEPRMRFLASLPPGRLVAVVPTLEISGRNNVPLTVLAVRPYCPPSQGEAHHVV